MPIASGHVDERWRAAFGREVLRDRDIQRPSAAAFAGGPDEAERALHSLCGLLWNCTDALPSRLCRELRLPTGVTYASAARKVRWRITSA